MIIYSFISISDRCTQYGHGRRTKNKLTFILHGNLFDFGYFFSSYFCIQEVLYYYDYWCRIDVIAGMSIERLRKITQKTQSNHLLTEYQGIKRNFQCLELFTKWQISTIEWVYCNSQWTF